MFIGRLQELSLLEEAYTADKNCLAVIYGRRRIGKSSLVKQFSLDKPRNPLERSSPPGICATI